MKRVNNLYNQICSIENLMLADKKARKGKSMQYGVISHDKRRGCNILTLHNTLMDHRYQTSAYNKFTLYDPKEREVCGLPFYPDRIVHHAIMNYLEALFVSTFTADSYSCIKGKGIHDLKDKLQAALRDIPGTTYCLKLDIRKFYASIDRVILKQQLRRKIKDLELLELLDEIIDSAEGVPIGNYLSQYFANFYLTRFDHWIKEDLRIKYYFRYADDMVILSQSKEHLHHALAKIRLYLEDHLKLSIKPNYQVFPVSKRGIDLGGYRHYHTHVAMRKHIKQNLCRAVSARKGRATIAALRGWAIHCDSRHLLKKLNLT